MICKEIIKYLEDWAPKGAAWIKDNPGLQAGSESRELENIFLCLELTEGALKEAVKKKCNFIFTHHPLLFQPLKKLNFDKDRTSQLIEQLIKHDITLYSAHTNLDFSQNGVSFQLAKKIGLSNVSFLKNLENNQLKLIVFVPYDNIPQVSEAIFSAGGGIIGNYDSCSFSSEGQGTFKGNNLSNPAIGTRGKFENVKEARLEVLANTWAIDNIVRAMLKAHPYEQPAYDIYPLNNENINFGYGAMGILEEPITGNEFMKNVARQLNTACLRFSGNSDKIIKRVAVCGGSGSDLIPYVINSDFDAFITADIKYHSFSDAENSNTLLIDAGHYETEVVVLDEVKNRLEDFIMQSGSDNKVHIYNDTTNPVKYFNTFKE